MTQIETVNTWADSPLIDPKKDCLGYASFANYLADSICKMTLTEGFVIAVYGSCCSGKSTLLNFLIHYLKHKPEEERPIIISFNPWLFSGYKDITRSFFEQLQNVLSQVKSMPKGLKERIADFAKVISEIPLPYTETVKPVATLLDDKEKETSEFKQEVEDKLVQQQQRIVITIDDIERLPAEDIRQLFRIFSAIPNFTNVVYFLTFDKEVIIKTIAEDKEIDKDTYLQKIINVAFDLPAPEKTSLRKLLFEKLDSIFSNTESQLFDQTRWSDIYLLGIDHFITNIHDIVRLTNTLRVTYPSLKSEVNLVDFVAIESLRVFCPIIYNIIGQNPHAFIGKIDSSVNKLENLYHAWIAQLPTKDKQPIKNILMHLFPKFQSVWNNSYLNVTEQEELKWRENMRICSLETFPVYFRLTLSTSELSNNHLKVSLSSAEDVEIFRENLLKLANQRRLNGKIQARAFLEQLEDYPEQEVPVNCIPLIVQSLFDVDENLLASEDELTSMFDLGSKVIISRFILRLLIRLEEKNRFEVLKKVMTHGKSLTMTSYEITLLKDQYNRNILEKFNLEEEWPLKSKHLQSLEEIATARQHEADNNN